jgi:serine/threonine-protein kinase
MYVGIGASTVLGLTLALLGAGCGGAMVGSQAGQGGNGSGGNGGAGKGGNGSGGSASGSGGQGQGGGVANGQGGAAGSMPGAGPFPSTSTFYQDISHAAVDSESTMIMTALSQSGWSSGPGIDVSFNIFSVDSSVARRPFQNGGDDPDCDTAPVPIPPGGNVEGNPDFHCADGGDCHLLVYQGMRLYELYQADISTGTATGGTFSGGCLAVWDLTHDYWQPMAPPNFSRGDHCNGADAADMPMSPLILTADDVRSGTIKHAMRFTIPNANIRASVYVHPATHIGGPSGGSDQLPYGARLRLRGDYDLTKLSSPEAQAVAKALQLYGMFLADGGHLFISATTDVADVMDTGALKGLKATDFEMVDGGTRYNWRDYQCQRTVITN